jgi:hypothetical protein
LKHECGFAAKEAKRFYKSFGTRTDAHGQPIGAPKAAQPLNVSGVELKVMATPLKQGATQGAGGFQVEDRRQGQTFKGRVRQL